MKLHLADVAEDRPGEAGGSGDVEVDARILLTHGSYLPARNARTARSTLFGLEYQSRLPVNASCPSTVTLSSPIFPRTVSTRLSGPRSCAATRAAMVILTGQTGQ